MKSISLFMDFIGAEGLCVEENPAKDEREK
jgi:hypothetical protein